MKRIAINGRFLSQAVTGVQRYAHELLLELDLLLASRDAGSVPVEVLVPRSVMHYPSYRSLIIKEVGRFNGQAWEQIELPLYCRGRLLFTPCGGAPVLHGCHVVTIPDAAVFATPKAYSLAYRTWYRWLHTRMGMAARRVITVSEFSKSELVRWCGIERSKVTVTVLGCDHIFAVAPDGSILDKYGLRKSSYVLAVGSRNPNKNSQGVVRAMALFRGHPPSLVIAGNMNTRVFAGSEPIPDSIINIGHITDPQLRALYESAACFVFPSFYEGFGLPPLEAMACGCPVIAGDIGALRETCGDAALFCDPTEPATMAERIADIMTEKELRERLVDGGRTHSERYRWAKTAAETWKILEEVATSS